MTNAGSHTEALLDTKAAAAVLGLSPTTLAIWRCRDDRDQPSYVRVGARSVRYSPSELARWVASREQRPRGRRRKVSP